jgi:arabinose-5-phosphate isomerase
METFNKVDSILDIFKDIIDKSNMSFIVSSLVRHAEDGIIFCGLGKNWQTAERASKTFVSMGINASALDAVGALHGDIGIIKNQFVFFLSKSGNTKEVIDIINYIRKIRDERRINPYLIGVCLNDNSKMKNLVDSMISTDKEILELDKNNIIPTLSVLIIELIIDYIGVSVFEKKPYLIYNYKYNHPGGEIGKKLGSNELL